jgi:hypothetical protein
LPLESILMLPEHLLPSIIRLTVFDVHSDVSRDKHRGKRSSSQTLAALYIMSTFAIVNLRYARIWMRTCIPKALVGIFWKLRAQEPSAIWPDRRDKANMAQGVAWMFDGAYWPQESF